MLERIHRGIGTFVWRALLVGIIVLASYVSITRVVMGLLPNSQASVGAMLSEQMGTSLGLGDIRGELIGFTPHLTFQDLALELPGSSEDTLIIKRGTVSIDPWQSLLALQPRLGGLLVSGASVELRLRADDQTDWRAELATLSAIAGQFRKVTVTDAELVLIDREHTSRLTLNLEIHRERSRRDIRLTLTDQGGMRATFEGSGVGDLERPETFDGDFHGQLLGTIPPVLGLMDMPLQGHAAVDYWLQLRSGVPKITSRSAFTALSTAVEDSTSPAPLFERLEFAALIRRKNGRWLATLQDLNIQQSDSELGLDKLQVTFDGQGLSIAANDIELAAFNDIVLATHLLPQRPRAILTAVAPRGEVRALSMTIDDIGQPLDAWSVTAELTNATISAFAAIPGISQLDATLEVNQAGAAVWVDSQNSGLHLPKIYSSPLMFNTVQGKLTGRWQDERLLLDQGVFDVAANTHRARALFAMDIALTADSRQAQPTELYLSAGISNATEDLVGLYVPTLIKPRLYQWLGTLVPRAKINTAAFVWRGSLKPYGQAEQTMQLALDMAETTVNYHPDWPAMTDTSATAYIDTDRVSVWAAAARSGNIELTNLAVEVDAGKDQGELRINTAFASDAGELLSWLNDTPIAGRAPVFFADANAEGPVTGSATVGLNVGELTRPAAVDVAARLDASVSSQRLGLTIDALAGEFFYRTETGFRASNLAGRLMGQPLAIAIGPGASSIEDASVLNARFESSLPSPIVTDWLTNLLNMELESTQLPVSGVLDLVAEVAIGEQALVRVSTDMLNAAIDLPEPVAKPIGRSAPLELEFAVDADTSWKAFWSDRVMVEGYRKQGKLIGATIDLTPRTRPINLAIPPHKEELTITGSIPKLSLEPWLPIWSAYRSYTGADSIDMALTVNDVDISALWLGPVDVGSVQIDLTPYADWTMLGINADWLDAELTLGRPDQPLSLIINSLDFDQFSTKLSDMPDTAAVLTPPSLMTPIDVVIANVEYGGQSLGAVTFQLDSNGNRLLASNIQGNIIDTDLLQGTSLAWVRSDDDRYQTTIDIEATLGDVSRSLRELTTDPVVKSTRGSASGTLSWQGSPADMHLNKLSGALDIVILEGAFLPVPAGASGVIRLLSLLNLSDLFGRANVVRLFNPGVAFKKAQGEFIFEPGQISIPDFVVDADGGGFQIDSDIDLLEQTIDGELVVTLPLADNIPWVAALAAGLPVGAGAYLVGKLFEDQVKSLTSGVYSVTGNIATPKVSFIRIFDASSNKERSAPTEKSTTHPAGALKGVEDTGQSPEEHQVSDGEAPSAIDPTPQ